MTKPFKINMPFEQAVQKALSKKINRDVDPAEWAKVHMKAKNPEPVVAKRNNGKKLKAEGRRQWTKTKAHFLEELYLCMEIVRLRAEREEIIKQANETIKAALETSPFRAMQRENKELRARNQFVEEKYVELVGICDTLKSKLDKSVSTLIKVAHYENLLDDNRREREGILHQRKREG